MDKVVLIGGQCGHGKTTTVNRLLGVNWHTDPVYTGTLLPYMKCYEVQDGDTYECELIPRIEKRVATKISLLHFNDSEDFPAMTQELSETVSWQPDGDPYPSDRQLYPEVSSLTFVDLMGIGENLLQEQYYKEVYREFAHQATDVLWISDITRRAYGQDASLLKDLKNDFPKLERFVICLNKVDIFALQKGQTSMETLTEWQIEEIKQKCSNVSEEFRSFMPEASFEVLFYSAVTGFNFQSLNDMFFVNCND